MNMLIDNDIIDNIVEENDTLNNSENKEEVANATFSDLEQKEKEMISKLDEFEKNYGDKILELNSKIENLIKKLTTTTKKVEDQQTDKISEDRKAYLSELAKKFTN